MDKYDVVIPREASPGRYDVKIKLLEVPFGPNYCFSDFLKDEDVYDGVEVGTITIIKQK